MTVVANARGVLLSTSAASLHHFSATLAGPLLEGTPDNDSFWGDGGVTVILAGGAGDDIYHLYSARNTALDDSDAGIDTVETWMDYRLPAHIENLVVTGGGRQATGNSLDNIISGAAGSQTLDGSAGDDVLIGGAGADIFAVSRGDGSDLILDFAAEDSLRLTGFGFSSFDQIAAQLTQDGDDTVLDLGDGEILVFADTAVADLGAEQFALELDTGGWTLTFADDFDSLDLWDGGNGTWDSNFWWGDPSGVSQIGQDQWYIDTDYAPTAAVNPFSVADGVLTITAAPADAAIQPLIGGYDYTSGLLTTYPTFAQTYGYFEIRADMPEDHGAWPAFWLLPADGAWPPELDVIEKIGQTPNELILTAHSNQTGAHVIDGHHADVSDSAGFHRFGVLWGPEEIAWTYDGVVVATTDTPADMHGDMYMIVNLALGGIAGTPGADLADGAEMQIDYIRAYALDDVALPPIGPDGGDDTLIGTAADDVLSGGAGNDFIFGDAGDDLLLGGAGDDTLRGGGGIDSYDGGAGGDTILLTGARAALTVDLDAGTLTTASGPETFVSIENIVGGLGNDTIAGSADANALSGGDGRDLLIGRGGDDLLSGGAGADTFRFTRLDTAGGDGHDTVADFAKASDKLSFLDVIDADGDGDSDLDDLVAAVADVSDGGTGGDVTVSFGNGASITFLGSGTGSVDALTDLVDDAAAQIQVS
ncbi:MAG: family 16 glycosylhydrolase [Kiloniellaceae bacterium]